MVGLPSPSGKKINLPDWLIASFWILVVAAVWFAAVRYLTIPDYILPSPELILAWIVDRPGYFLSATVSTLTLIAVGFFAGIAAAVPVGFALAKIGWLERALYPFIVFLQTMPLITIVPILIIWFGYGLATTWILVAFSVFFPVAVNAIAGVRSTPDRLFFVTRTMGASSLQTWRHVDWPMALPYLMSSFRISLAVAVTVSVVAEFIASNDGLGYLALRGVKNRDTVQVIAVVLIAAALGVLLNAVAQLAEQKVLRKYRD
ncbi:ABC transporter permease [Mesorhizobium sp.]|uniref:ABC transporter permease n=1 Tax=Mesorhizobium sp. TaxID=1871066 RepID=UPI000FE68BDE|nr:ABC transporter permease [Mesorhizobium sp.]RWM24728.1 MAG: ABC transporter permease [Mesorhizobium sp.]